jgi:translation initiation factor 2 beta subunit (eIF-2beta)/eIF-5
VSYPFRLMDEPEYLICLQCETPTYQFEHDSKGKLLTAVCQTCGNDDPTDFMTEAEIEEHSGG